MTTGDGFGWGTEHADVSDRELDAAWRAEQLARGNPAPDDEPGVSPDEHGDEGAIVVVRSWRPVDLADVLDGTWRPAVPTVGRRDDARPILYPGRVHTVAAESEAGKTWLALMISRDELDAERRVVFVDFEDDVGFVVSRLLALQTKADLIREGFAYLRPEVAIGSGIHLDDLRDTLIRYEPSLVVIDGINNAMTLHGLDVLSNRDVAAFSHLLLARIAATGPAVLALDHVNKATETRGRYALGAVHKLNGVNGAAFTLSTIKPMRIGGAGRSRIRIAKDRPGQLRRDSLPSTDDSGMDWYGDLVVISHGEDFVEVGIETPVAGVRSVRKRPTVYMARVSEVLADRAEPLSQREILARVTGKSEHITAAIAALVDDGFLAVELGSRGSRLHRLVKPFAEADS